MSSARAEELVRDDMKRQRKDARLSSSPAPAFSPASDFGGGGGGEGGRHFSLEDVKRIVQCACDQRSEELRAEYDNILVGQMQEQFNCFTQFNKEQQDRDMASKDHDEMDYFS